MLVDGLTRVSSTKTRDKITTIITLLFIFIYNYIFKDCGPKKKTFWKAYKPISDIKVDKAGGIL